MGKELLVSQIVTPDGTVLVSRHTHDYRHHTDKVTGEFYFVDGGNSYTRTSVNEVPAKNISLYSNHSHKLIREIYSWGTYGEHGEHDLAYILLKDMTNNHIINVLNTQPLRKHIRKVFEDELEWRSEDV